MKIQCSGCEAAEATVFCCADEAALCVGCDENIHAANKQESKHQRVPLSSSASPLPMCDICQETLGYFICLEDRAFLCRKCDVAIHTMNAYVFGHQRFLLTGVKVGLEASWCNVSSTNEKLHAETLGSHPLRSFRAPTISSTLCPVAGAAISSRDGKAVENRKPEASKFFLAPGPATSDAADWQVKEKLDFVDSNQNNSTSREALSMEDRGVHCLEWWKILKQTEEELLNDRCAKIDNLYCAVPELFGSRYSLSGSQSVGDTSNISTSNVQNIADANNDSQSCQESTSSKCRCRPKRIPGA